MSIKTFFAGIGESLSRVLADINPSAAEKAALDDATAAVEEARAALHEAHMKLDAVIKSILHARISVTMTDPPTSAASLLAPEPKSATGSDAKDGGVG